MTLRSIHRGASPNCSATGSVVGIALVSAAVASAVINAWAERFSRLDEDPPDGRQVRREADGSLVAWEDGHVHTDALLPATIGTGRPVPGALTAPTEAHIAATERCVVACDDCYLAAGPDSEARTDAERLDARLVELAQAGVLQVALGGGELAVDDTVVHLARRIRALGMVPNLTTSGFGLTEARATALAGLLGQVNISWDGPAYAAVRGFDGQAAARRAVRIFVAAGARVGVNTVLARPVLPTLEAFASEVAALGVAEWQWLRLKPAGRARATYGTLTPTPAERHRLWPRLLDIEACTGLVMRIDCALVPWLAEHDLDPERMALLGVRGCPGSHSLLAVDPAGGLTPCSFADESAEHAPLEQAWATRLTAWRRPLPEPCHSCPYASVCRGGCRVVAGALTGDPLAPDPECARVSRHQTVAPKRRPQHTGVGGS